MDRKTSSLPDDDDYADCPTLGLSAWHPNSRAHVPPHNDRAYTSRPFIRTDEMLADRITRATYSRSPLAPTKMIVNLTAITAHRARNYSPERAIANLL